MEIRRRIIYLFVGWQITSSFLIAGPISISWGMSARQGDRPTMEDTHNHQVWSNATGFFGIYDGHAGMLAAKITEETLPDLVQKGSFESPVAARESFEKAFLETDQLIVKQTPSGTCALAALIDETKLHIAWAGDSRALLIRDNTIIFATQDHKPDMPAEKVRIERLGSWVTQEPYDVARVAGLAISRSLGDRIAKIISHGSIIAIPDVCSVDIQQNDILVMACDGIWDVLSNEKVALLVNLALSYSAEELAKIIPSQAFLRSGKLDRTHENGNSHHLQLVARFIRDTAYNDESSDNLSVQVIRL